MTSGNRRADNLGADTGTCMGITELVPGDSVTVTGKSDDTASILQERSGFIGHLIQPYC